MYELYLRKHCFSTDGEKQLIGTYDTKQDAFKAMYDHFGEKIYYIRTIIAAPDEHLYDVGSHITFYSIKNTVGEMSIQVKKCPHCNIWMELMARDKYKTNKNQVVIDYMYNCPQCYRDYVITVDSITNEIIEDRPYYFG